MGNTSKMIALLGKMRKQMNGAVADTMFYYGTNYGLNYGVSLPTVREIAQAEGCDHTLAQYLFKQQVRELKLAALHIADPAQLTPSTAEDWAKGITNSELAEEAAFAFLHRAPSLMQIIPQWMECDNEFATYAAMMAAARSNQLSDKELCLITKVVERYPSSRPIAQGAVAMMAAAFLNDSLKGCVKEVLSSFVSSPAADYISEEMSWRMEF